MPHLLVLAVYTQMAAHCGSHGLLTTCSPLQVPQLHHSQNVVGCSTLETSIPSPRLDNGREDLVGQPWLHRESCLHLFLAALVTSFPIGKSLAEARSVWPVLDLLQGTLLYPPQGSFTPKERAWGLQLKCGALCLPRVRSRAKLCPVWDEENFQNSWYTGHEFYAELMVCHR